MLMMNQLMIVVCCLYGVSGQGGDNGTNVIQSVEAMVPDGVFNLAEIDWPFIFGQLVTPKGLVTQFSLELLTQTIFTSGWIILGGIWQFVTLQVGPGETQDTLANLSFLLGWCS